MADTYSLAQDKVAVVPNGAPLSGGVPVDGTYADNANPTGLNPNAVPNVSRTDTTNGPLSTSVEELRAQRAGASTQVNRDGVIASAVGDDADAGDLFPVRLIRAYRPLGAYHIPATNQHLHGEPTPVAAGSIIMVPKAEAKQMIAADIAARADALE